MINDSSKEPVVKLTDQDKSLLKLVARSNPDADGWCKVSKPLYLHFSKIARADLFLFEPVGEAGRCRLTDFGNDMLTAMEYL